MPTWVRRYRAVLVSPSVSIRCPATVTVPPDGLSSPATRFSSVDLPLPDGPITATASPAATCTLTRSSAGTPPAAYRLFTSLSSISAFTAVPPVRPVTRAHGCCPHVRRQAVTRVKQELLTPCYLRQASWWQAPLACGPARARGRAGTQPGECRCGRRAISAGRARWAALPRRTVRLRLTALYGALFLASGAGLLAITNILARSWPWPGRLRTPVGSRSGASARSRAARVRLPGPAASSGRAGMRPR